MSSFDHHIHCDESGHYQPTAQDWAEYGAWLYQQARNAWQDAEDRLQQPEDDQRQQMGEDC